MKKRSNQPYIAAAAGVVIVALSELAAAQTSATSSTSSSSSSSSDVHLDSTAATQLISTTTLRQMLTISNALAARTMVRMGPPAVADSGRAFGMAAGGAADKWNVWGSLSDDDNRYNDGTNRLSTNATNTVVGADLALSPTLNLGVSAAFDRVDGDAGNAASNYKSDGYTIAPYIGWQLSKEWSLDATMGWGEGEFNQTGSVTDDSERFFYGANLNYANWYGNWQVTGKGSYLHGEEKYEDQKVAGVTIANSATKNKIDQWRLGVQAAYWMNGMMPYAGLAYSTDSNRKTSFGGAQPTDNLGKNAWVWSLGVNFISVKNSLTGGIAYNKESGRSNSKADNLMANINYRF